MLRDGGDAYVNAVRMQNGWVVAVIAPEQRQGQAVRECIVTPDQRVASGAVVSSASASLRAGSGGR